MDIVDYSSFTEKVKQSLKFLLEEGVIEFEVASIFGDDSEYRELKVLIDGDVVCSTILSVERRS